MLMARVNMSLATEQQVLDRIANTSNFDRDFYNAFLKAQILCETFCIALVLCSSSIKTSKFVATMCLDAILILTSSFYKQFKLF